MTKSWWIVCNVNNVDQEMKMIVKANTQKNAESFAINNLYKDGYSDVKVISCKEM